MWLNLEEPITDAITRVRFSPQSNNNLLVSSWDSSVRLYDVEKNELRLQARSDAAILDCCFADHSLAFSAASDGSVFRYDLHTGSHSAVGQHDDSATCIEYSDETSQVITTGWDRKILSWDPRSSKVSRGVACTTRVESISLCGFELLVATGSLVRKYDLRKVGGESQEEDLLMSFCIRCVRAMAGCEGFAVGSVDGQVTLQSNSDKMGYTFRCVPRSRNANHNLVTVNDMAFNPCVSGVFITGDYEGHVIAWDAKSRKRLMELPRYPNSVASLAYNHTGELLAIASSFTYQEANEIEDQPQIFIQEMGANFLKSASAGRSARKQG